MLLKNTLCRVLFDNTATNIFDSLTIINKNMKTVSKTIAITFGMMALLTLQNVNAQTYYAYVSAKKKNLRKQLRMI